MSGSEPVTTEIDRRVEEVVSDEADPRPMAARLTTCRDEVLGAWLAAARAQPFHESKPDAAVTDHIPALLDSVTRVLGRDPHGETRPPMEDSGVIEAATGHARVRFEQGIESVAIVTEFRLLRHEISRAVRDAVDDVSPRDILAAQAIIDDALDGAATIALTALSDQIENLREEFLAMTLHDVRQPITLITGSLELARRWLAGSDPDVARVAEVIEDAVTAVHEADTVLDTLADASRVATGAMEPEVEPASLEAIVGEALALVDSQARSRVRVQTDGGPRLVGLWDPNLLRRVVSNLVSNALKYSPDPVPVEVSVARASVRVAVLSVRDQGMGLSGEELGVMFRRFGRTERARAQGIRGLGLGLYACRGIVEAHGGTIAIESGGPGLGTVVIVHLPLLVEDLEV
jgi:signal transduction histidine kinase